MRLKEFLIIEEINPILKNLSACNKKGLGSPEGLVCRIKVYRDFIIKLKKDINNDVTDTKAKEIKGRITSLENKIKSLKLQVGELNRKKVEQDRQSKQPKNK